MADVKNTDEPQTVEEARRQVEQTRERLADTVDGIEDRLAETTHRFNLADRIRENPWPALAAAFSLGMFIAVVGSSRDDDDDDDDDEPRGERIRRIFRREPPSRRSRFKKILRRR